ncbi:DNA polymerase III subunit alpha [Shewanella glacialipiscicola]|uniref:DNA polymerase III subunit alpha n=1 Tax=Shewanella glacialipiscicola TaxID=614069 RepID=UPI003D78D2F7
MHHLVNTRSDFSTGSSILSPGQIASKAAELGYKSVAMIDNATISGMTALFNAANSLDTPIKVIIGASIKVFDDPTYRPPAKKSGEVAKKNPFWEAKLYVKNEEGLKALFRVLNAANSEDYFYYTPRIGLKELIVALKSGGLILSTGDTSSLFAHRNAAAIYKLLEKHVDASNRFIELIPVRSAFYDRVNTEAVSIARSSDSKFIYSRPALYEEGQAEALVVMSCIIGNDSINSRWVNRQYNKDLHILSPEQLAAEIEELKARTDIDIADSTDDLVNACTYDWTKLDMCLPQMAENEFTELVRLCKEGWAKRLSKKVFGYKPTAAELETYKDRLQTELGVLRDMKFDRYFLLVRDVIVWSKENDIMVGPARGSAAGSLVAYLIGITDVDPIRFGLIFERFLNPDRLDYPDIDTDFMSSRRGEVINYIQEKFGRDRVAGISNFTSLGAASSIRDVARIHEVPNEDLRFTKAIDQNMSFADAEQLVEIEPYIAKHSEKFEISRALYGKNRSLGRHAAGIVVAGEPLGNRCVVERRGSEPTVNWDKRTVEDWGLIKLDILGLSTLDMLFLIKQKLAKIGTKIDWTEIPLDDEKTLRAFAEGRTVGVFQFTSGGMRQLLKSLALGGKTLTFEDIYATTALFRPGPLQSGMTEEYVRIKQGIVKPHYPHPSAEPALRETSGIYVYQEQTMQLARDLAGFTMAESDYLRKAIGKKDADLMAKQGAKFIEGAMSLSGLSEEDATEIWEALEKNGAYQFNKSHSVAYTLISYACMYAKVHYTGDFFAAALSIASDDDIGPIVKDAASFGYNIAPPDINKSTNVFEVGYDAARDQKVLHCPLDRIKQVSAKSYEAIVEARKLTKDGNFESMEHFLSLVQKRACNKRVVENMNRVGAFASIEPEQIDPRHPDRLRDQKELLPNLMVGSVKANRGIAISDEAIGDELANIIDDINAKAEDEHGDPTGINPVVPNFGKSPKVMVITDCAAFSEDNDGKFASGKSFNYMQSALKAAGMKKSDCYYTGLVKAKKMDKQLTAKEISTWSDILKREIELLKPAVIVCAGGAASRFLLPDVRGGWEDLAGKIIYDVKMDCSILLAPNPQMIYIKPDVQDILNSVMMEVAEIIS